MNCRDTENTGPGISGLPSFPNMSFRDLQKLRMRRVRPGGVGVRLKNCRDPCGRKSLWGRERPEERCLGRPGGCCLGRRGLGGKAWQDPRVGLKQAFGGEAWA